MNDQDDHDFVSKSQRKREMLALQTLGEALLELSPGDLATIPIPDRLRDAIDDYKRMDKRGALHRQRQFIGKVMRTVDADPIREAMDRLQHGSDEAVAHLKRVERWRDRLLEEGDSALGELVDTHPGLDRHRCRQLIRAADREKKHDKPPRSARALFRYLRDVVE